MGIEFNWIGLVPIGLSIIFQVFSKWNQISATAEKYKEKLLLTRKSIAIELEEEFNNFYRKANEKKEGEKETAFFDTVIIKHYDSFENILEKMRLWMVLDNEVIDFKEKMNKLINYNLLTAIFTILFSVLWLVFDVYDPVFWKKNIAFAFISVTSTYLIIIGIIAQAYFLYSIHQEPINKELEWDKMIKDRRIE